MDYKYNELTNSIQLFLNCFYQYYNFKGIDPPKCKIVSLITHHHVVPHPLDPRSSSERKWRYFWWNPRALWPSIDSNGTTPFKTQKGIRTLWKYSMWHQWYFIKLREYLFVLKENKNYFIQQFLLFHVSLCIVVLSWTHIEDWCGREEIIE